MERDYPSYYSYQNLPTKPVERARDDLRNAGGSMPPQTSGVSRTIDQVSDANKSPPVRRARTKLPTLPEGVRVMKAHGGRPVDDSREEPRSDHR